MRAGDVESKLPVTNIHAHTNGHAHLNGEHWIPAAGAIISPSVTPRASATGDNSFSDGPATDLQSPQKPYLPPYMAHSPPTGSAAAYAAPQRLWQAPQLNGYCHERGGKNDAPSRGSGALDSRPRTGSRVPVPRWTGHSLAAALAALALAADGVPSGGALAQQAISSTADAGRVLLPSCILAVGRGALSVLLPPSAYF